MTYKLKYVIYNIETTPPKPPTNWILCNRKSLSILDEEDQISLIWLENVTQHL